MQKEETATKLGTPEDKHEERDEKTIMNMTWTRVGCDKILQQQNGECKYGVRKNNNDVRNAKSDGVRVLS